MKYKITYEITYDRLFSDIDPNTIHSAIKDGNI
jgi:hypothetical protein